MKNYVVIVAITLLLSIFHCNALNGVGIDIKEPKDGSIFYTRNVTIIGTAHACCNDKLKNFTWLLQWENGSYTRTIDLDGLVDYSFSINISLHYKWNRIIVMATSYSGMKANDSITIYYYGPIANAHGPYKGNDGEEIKFHGSAYGGVKPYKYEWHFGDGNISNEENPKHAYKKEGLYHVKFIVTDAQGHRDINYTYAAISDSRPPHVKIVKPYRGIYIFDRKIIPSFINVAIGKITVEAYAYDNESGIKSVAFYIDNEMICNITTPPYMIEYKGFGLHDIVTKAYDYSLNVAVATAKLIAI